MMAMPIRFKLGFGLTALLLAACTYEGPETDFSAYSATPLCFWGCSEPALVGLWIPDTVCSSMRSSCDSPIVLTWYSLRFDSCTYVSYAGVDTGYAEGVRVSSGWITKDSVLWMNVERAWSNIDDNDDNDPFVDSEPRRYPSDRDADSARQTFPADSVDIAVLWDTYDQFDTTNASRWVYTLSDNQRLSLRQCCGDSCFDAGTFIRAQ